MHKRLTKLGEEPDEIHDWSIEPLNSKTHTGDGCSVTSGRGRSCNNRCRVLSNEQEKESSNATSGEVYHIERSK